jgi:predicted dehydrogenase
MRFGVLGTGRISRRMIADLQSTENVEVTAIASRSERRARWFADQHGIENPVTTYQALIDRDDVDAVYVALPPSMHAQWACAAAAVGRHVLCEKPLAMDTLSAIAIQDACRKSGASWLDATAWLHHERTEAFKKLIADGRLGSIGHISASVSFYRPFLTDEHRLDPAMGGGCLLDLGWYVAGMVNYFGGTPNRVYADAVIENGVEIRLTGMMWLPGGVTATISCGYDTASRKWFEIAGTSASLICDDFTRPWPDKPARCWIHEASGAVESLAFTGHQERRMIARLASVVSDEDDLNPQDASAVKCDLSVFQSQAITTHRILDAIKQSLQQREPVEVI